MFFSTWWELITFSPLLMEHPLRRRHKSSLLLVECILSSNHLVISGWSHDIFSISEDEMGLISTLYSSFKFWCFSYKAYQYGIILVHNFHGWYMQFNKYTFFILWSVNLHALRVEIQFLQEPGYDVGNNRMGAQTES